MKKIQLSVLISGIASTSLLLFSSSVWATGVTGSVGATSVPSLSGSMLVILSLLLFAVAFRLTKQNKAVNKLFISLLGVGMIISAGSGFKLISDAQAVVGPVVNLSGGIFGGSPDYAAILQNDTGQPVTITFTPEGGANPSNCFLEGNSSVAVKPAKSLAKQAKLAALSPPCGASTTTFFPTGDTYTVTIPAGQRCFIGCSAAGE